MRRIRLVKRRGPVKNLDRSRKAQMINNVIESFLDRPVRRLKILDVGCGNGGICSQFIANNDVYGVDIEDLRKIKKGFTFKQVNSAKLPFKDNFFDIVISNHTIEHIPEQGQHLDEIKRVLKADGLIYLATPNRSSPIMRGHVGNPWVLRWREMRPLLEKHGFAVHEQTVKMLKKPDAFLSEFEHAKYLPVFVLRVLRPMFPSHIFILKQQYPKQNVKR